VLPSVRPAPSESSSGGAPERAAGTDDELAALVDRALHGASERDEEARLPAVPTRSHVSDTLRDVQPSLAACTESAGIVRARLVVEGPRGRVASATVSGDLEPESRSCIARVLRQARFDPFAREHFEIEFPFVL
jgi:hypothetical protein